MRILFVKVFTAALVSVVGVSGTLAEEIKHGFHATVTAKPGKGDELVALFLRAPALTTEECVVFMVSRSASNKDLVYVTEGWTSQEAHSRFFASDTAKPYISRIAPLVEGEGIYADAIPVGGKAEFN